MLNRKDSARGGSANWHAGGSHITTQFSKTPSNLHQKPMAVSMRRTRLGPNNTKGHSPDMVSV